MYLLCGCCLVCFFGGLFAVSRVLLSGVTIVKCFGCAVCVVCVRAGLVSCVCALCLWWFV